MAKVSPVSIKYMIYASFKAAGPLEKPDVIGAIFGQTEGLLGSDMEMRELQKDGKIGRIEVNLEIVDGKSVGEIQVPTALDKSETTLIAAALETIDRIGPTEAEITITKVEDVRASKRDFILDRAKRLMNQMDGGDSFREMSASLKDDARVEKIQEYGENKLPCGDISGKEIIVVEGRADVVNLLRNRVNNVIGMDGAKLPREIIELSNTKELTVFVDGDRGGKLIANNLINHAKVAFIASAPEGKEVEELTSKEILISLRRRMSIEEFLRDSRGQTHSDISSENDVSQAYSGNAKEKMRELYSRVRGSKEALLLDNNMDVIKKVSSKEVSRSLRDTKKKVYAVVMDGPATASFIKSCDEMGISCLGATNFSQVEDAKVQLVSL